MKVLKINLVIIILLLALSAGACNRPDPAVVETEDLPRDDRGMVLERVHHRDQRVVDVGLGVERIGQEVHRAEGRGADAVQVPRVRLLWVVGEAAFFALNHDDLHVTASGSGQA